ncbi:MAG: hypothetical protein A3J81_04170 [Nitrospirae bacterium RIFOXYB2_FULL_43_5]|nr:MAG: hypothetical protein A2X54_07950 [Nitrospirae bacterium GWF2_44_13]OGW33896.1 MAG: hypothetical protein A2088_00505 [Nitrospirae bacterium GWD2_44_7]OGW66302.1 MAG: hypothetical protein A2222_03630 [Nitrospirae bacterium RIFOXYA2_FULL_44_9]OGW72960.1 MAG: hypothetical protein A3J81_04170 [Nitrospirae bacterium RIFOXYB2_FULL_43_5]HBG93379.1 hypothetical protein [Nitrospiraceae bacterium]
MKKQVKYLQNLFYDMMNDYGRVFVVIKQSERTVIGDRGFTDEEKESGLVLAFNSKNYKTLQWTEDGSIVTTLGFGSNNKVENCFLHSDDIISVYSPDAKIKFDRWDMMETKDSLSVPQKIRNDKKDAVTKGKIVSLDSFRKIKP